MNNQKSTLVILNPQEQSLGFLNPDYVKIKETNELYKLRTLEITHPLKEKYDTLLKHGNKIWQQATSDNNSCLYIIRFKSYDYNSNTVTIQAMEAAVELGQYKAVRGDPFTWKVNEFFIEMYFGELFNPGYITPTTQTITYNGVITPLAIINKIQKYPYGEFQFRYVYNTETDKINRYIDYLPHIGQIHNEIIEINYNTTEIDCEIDESNVAIGAIPLGENGNGDFHKNRAKFEELEVYKGQKIPLYYSKDEKGIYVEGPLATAPYTKYRYTKTLICDNPDELKASYLTIQAKEGQDIQYPRLTTFTSNEENPINLYWECVKNIKKNLYPEIEIKTTLTTLNRLTAFHETVYNIGDIIQIRLPHKDVIIPCRITKTIKNPNMPESTTIEINTYNNSFLTDLYKKTSPQRYYSNSLPI